MIVNLPSGAAVKVSKVSYIAAVRKSYVSDQKQWAVHMIVEGRDVEEWFPTKETADRFRTDLLEKVTIISDLSLITTEALTKKFANEK